VPHRARAAHGGPGPRVPLTARLRRGPVCGGTATTRLLLPPLLQRLQEPLGLVDVPPRTRMLRLQFEYGAPFGDGLGGFLLPVKAHALAVVHLQRARASLLQ